jgi:hypothetical protein
MEERLPDSHPDMIRIVQAARHDLATKPAQGQAEKKSLSNALAAALGKLPGCPEDLENIDFLVHVLSVNRAAGSIDDDAFEQLLLRIKTRDGRADLVSRFTEELETEHGYDDEDSAAKPLP